MNCRAVALALVGWYLMVPLSQGDPIPKWDHYGSFDSAAECTTARENAIRAGVADATMMGLSQAEVKHALLLSECIASDDPRLK
jgi:hypothetical protein